MMGSYGKGTWRNKSLSLCIQDEGDAYKYDDELHPFDAAKNRLKAVSGGRHIFGGAPETEEHLTAKLEKTGTQHRLFLPCPHCGHYQRLVWDNMRFSHCRDTTGEWDLERVRRETFYECEFSLCHKPIYEDKHMPEMLRRRKWRQTNKKPFPRRLSIQISDLYSPFTEANWGEIAVEFIGAQGNPALLASWKKNRMGEASALQSDSRTPDNIDKLRGWTPPGEEPPEPGQPYRHNYLRGTIPVEPCLVAVLADVQKEVKKWVKVGYLPDGEIYVIDWGQCLSFEELSMIAEDPVPVGVIPIRNGKTRWEAEDEWDGPTVTATVGLIDEGYAELLADTRAFCQHTILSGASCSFFPSRGRGGITVRYTVQESETEALGEALRVYHFSDNDFKKSLYIARIARRVKPVKGIEPGPRLHMPSHLDRDFKAELCSEKLSQKKEDGMTREEWIKTAGTPNDWGDALKNALVLWHVMWMEFRDWTPSFEKEKPAASKEPENTIPETSNPSHAKVLQYLANAGGQVTVQQFDEDHDPIGPRLRTAMYLEGLVEDVREKVWIRGWF
jgi:phage terminase large subunit GpA-like protein